MDCERFGELSAELALGLVEGEMRAEAVAHADRCPTCREHLDSLAVTADLLLLLAPDADPPRSLSEAAVASLRTPVPIPERRRWRPSALVGIAASVAVLALAAGGAIGRTSSRPDGRTREYVAALHALGGASLRAAPLLLAGGLRAGEVFAYEGDPSWLFVSIEANPASVPDGTYSVDLIAPGSAPVVVDQVGVLGGRASLGRTVAVPMGRVREIRVVETSGVTILSAALER